MLPRIYYSAYSAWVRHHTDDGFAVYVAVIEA
jgi:hypothetical protein